MTPEVKDVFSSSEVARDPKRLNTFMFLLDPQGRLVHGFHGLSGRGEGRSDYAAEIAKGLAKLKLPEVNLQKDRPPVLPDLKQAAPGVPAGVRMFVRHEGRKPVVEVVPMDADAWKPLFFPEKSREIEAETLRAWLIQMYPPAIRTVDQRKPFQKIEGRLELTPAGADQNGRHALLSGEMRLSKGDDTQSAFEGTLQLVLTYRPDTPEVQTVRGVVEGDYLYRIRGTQRLPLKAAIESRPE